MKLKHLLENEAESTTSSSAGTSSGGEKPAAAAPAAGKADEGIDAGAAAPVEEGGEDWGTLAEGGDEPTGGTPAAKPADKPAAEPAKPAAAPQPAAAAPAKPAEPAPAPAAAAPAAQPAAPAAQPAAKPEDKPAAPAAETAEQKAAREKTEREAAEAAAKKSHEELVNYYKLPDDLAARLATEPEQVLPQLAAKMHSAVMQNVMALLNHQIPQALHNYTTVRETEQKSRSAFLGRWPTLEKYEAQVLQAGQLYRSLNPTAAPDVAILAIGKIVSDSLGLPYPPEVAAELQKMAGGVAAPAAAPAAAAAAPFKPAGGGGAAPAKPATETNEFALMAAEDLQERDAA